MIAAAVLARRAVFALAPLAAAAVAVAGLGRPGPAEAAFGAPWLSLEAPANPMDPQLKGAAFAVRAYRHESPLGAALVGRAEGIVDGKRRSIELDIRDTRTPGLFAVPAQWPGEGSWVVKIGFVGDSHSTLLVELGPDGGLRAEKYYGMDTRTVALGSVRVVQGDVSETQIDSRLQALAARTGD